MMFHFLPKCLDVKYMLKHCYMVIKIYTIKCSAFKHDKERQTENSHQWSSCCVCEFRTQESPEQRWTCLWLVRTAPCTSTGGRVNTRKYVSLLLSFTYIYMYLYIHIFIYLYVCLFGVLFNLIFSNLWHRKLSRKNIQKNLNLKKFIRVKVTSIVTCSGAQKHAHTQTQGVF